VVLHRVDEVLFEIPKAWALTSILVPPGAPRGFTTNLVLTRGNLQPDETLPKYADRQVAEMARDMKRFVLRARSDTTIGGEPAIVLRCGWHGTQGPVEQEITMLVRATEAILFTATVPKNQADKMLPLFRAVLGNVRLDGAFAR
jgi:hypothetical protein